jgi:hypothetical protein
MLLMTDGRWTESTPLRALPTAERVEPSRGGSEGNRFRWQNPAATRGRIPDSRRSYRVDRQEIRVGQKGHEMPLERFGLTGPFPGAWISDKLAAETSKE